MTCPGPIARRLRDGLGLAGTAEAIGIQKVAVSDVMVFAPRPKEAEQPQFVGQK